MLIDFSIKRHFTACKDEILITNVVKRTFEQLYEIQYDGMKDHIKVPLKKVERKV